MKLDSARIWEAKSSEEVFEKLGGLFIAEGYCRDTYVDV